jgi:DNA-binding PadR family transcriptional regulator
MTGTDIMDEIEKRSEGRYKPSPGSIYPMLAHLEEEGIIECKTEGRSKRYTLTEDGHDRLKAMFKRRGDLEHKTRLSRSIWLNLLDPHHQAHFHMIAIKTALVMLEELKDKLTPSERERILKRLGKAVSHIDNLMTTFKDGE